MPCVGSSIWNIDAFDRLRTIGVRTLCFLVIVIMSFGKPCNENAENNVKTKPYRVSPLMEENVPRPMSSHFLLSSLLSFRLEFLYILPNENIQNMPISASAFHSGHMAMNLLEDEENGRSNGNLYVNSNKPKTTSSRIVGRNSSRFEYRTTELFQASKLDLIKRN